MAGLADIKRPVETEWKRYERLMHDCMQADERLQQTVLQYIAARSGKQLRPLIVLLCAQLCNPVTDKTLRAAVALEMLHNASLVHDDVVDSSDTRRGQPAVHTQWSNKVAVLTGDYMLAKVIGLVAEVRNIRILEIVSNLGRNLSSGEMLQLHFGQSMWIDEERYLRVIDQKTAQLSRLAQKPVRRVPVVPRANAMPYVSTDGCSDYVSRSKMISSTIVTWRS